MRCEGSQLCKEKRVLGGVGVPSVSQQWPGACPEDRSHLPSREGMCDCTAQGWSVLSSLAKVAFPKPKGASAGRGQRGGGEGKKLI